MKKSIIAAGAASVALAAMPVVGAFAVSNGGTLTDVIRTTIDDTCAFTRQSPAHTVGTWVEGSTQSPATTTDTMTPASITLNVETKIGDSKFTVVCNDPDGYQVTATLPNLVKPATATDAAVTMAYLDSTTGSAGKWRFQSNGTGANIGNASGGNIALKETTTTTGTNFTVEYFAYPGASQAAGTYEGTVVYTFAQL